MDAYIDVYINDNGNGIVVEREHGSVSFDELIEAIWYAFELNITNYHVGHVGNDCVGCSMLGSVCSWNGYSNDMVDVEVIFTSWDVDALNETNELQLQFVRTDRATWLEDHRDI